MNRFKIFATCFIFISSFVIAFSQSQRKEVGFNNNWKFNLGEQEKGFEKIFDDHAWRSLNLPHDWSIEGSFSKDHPATFSGGALPGGIGWYRKNFMVEASEKGKTVVIEFNGVYRNSEVWINGNYLGKRPNGYITFQYDLTPYLNFGVDNIIAVKVDNSQQPNSRWYSGSGIYRDVNLIFLNPIHVAQWGTYITTPKVEKDIALVALQIKLKSELKKVQAVQLKIQVLDRTNQVVSTALRKISLSPLLSEFQEKLEVKKPVFWSNTNPYLYTLRSQVLVEDKVVDSYDTPFGIRTFTFDKDKGFLLNGKELKIRGVCNHHDLGALGSAFNVRAAERQLQLLQLMGCNGIRTSHNPPATQLLDLCDKMGFIVMDEAFDMWAKKKSDFDYSQYWNEWHKKDLEDLLLRDRNHPSIFMWSIGNEIPEQWVKGADTSGRVIARELASIVKSIDTTRPVTSANNEVNVNNNLFQSGALDIYGYNYNQEKWIDFPKLFPGKKLIGSETTSSLQTRGHYDMPSDSIRLWPTSWDKPLTTGNADYSCSAYDNCRAPWGSTHEETLKAFEGNPAVSGIFIWTGFDYLGEPTPYVWPARSSYFGILDLAGFPKDVYYLYQSLWTDKPVLHIFPHWNWTPGQDIDVWAYYNNADEVELFVNGKSLGKKAKTRNDMHISWRVKYEPGTVKAVSYKNGKIVLEKVVHTAGEATKIKLTADRKELKGNGKDLSFVTIQVTDSKGQLIPDAGQLISFKLEGNATIAGLDNGSPVSHESFRGLQHKAFNGLALAIIQAGTKSSPVKLTASSPGLEASSIEINIR